MDNYTITTVLTGIVEKTTLLRNTIGLVSAITRSIQGSISGFPTTYLTVQNPKGYGTLTINNVAVDTVKVNNIISANSFYDTINKNFIVGTPENYYLRSENPSGNGLFNIDNIYANDVISAKYFSSTKTIKNRYGSILSCCNTFVFLDALIYNLIIDKPESTGNTIVELNILDKIPAGQSITVRFYFKDTSYFKPIYFNSTEIIGTAAKIFICNFVSYDGEIIDCLPVIKVAASTQN